MAKILVGVAALCCIVGMVPASFAVVTTYVAPTIGVAFQEAQENAFLADTSGLTMIDFDDQVGDASLTGNEYAGLVPCTMATPTWPAAMRPMAASRSAYGSEADMGPASMNTVRPTLPATVLRISVARFAAVALR